MLLRYKTKKLEKACNDYSFATKIYGDNMATKLQMRIDQMTAFSSVEELIKYRIGRCHMLTGDRNGQYAMDLVHPYRLIFIVDKSGEIQVSEIIEIVDYH